jgi:serine/threonine protein kinase
MQQPPAGQTVWGLPEDEEEDEEDEELEEDEEEDEDEDDEEFMMSQRRFPQAMNAPTEKPPVIVISTSEEEDEGFDDEGDEDEGNNEVNLLQPRLHPALHRGRGKGKHGRRSYAHMGKPMTAPISPTSSASVVDPYADQLLFEDVRLQECISRGLFSDLYKGKLWSTTVAVKVIDLAVHSTGISGTQLELTHPLAARRYNQFQTEIKVMRTLRNPNLIEFMGVSVQFEPLPDGRSLPRKLCIITEYLGTSMRTLLSKQMLSFKRSVQLARDVASGLNWLSHKGIVIRNLSPSNLLIASNNKLKVSDYSCALFVAEQHANNEDFKGDLVCLIKGKLEAGKEPCYIAPEALTGKVVDSSCDVFSFGLILCEMMTGKYPIALTQSQTSFVEAVIANNIPDTHQQLHPQNVFLPVEKLILQCCHSDPTARPTFDEIISELSIMNDNTEYSFNMSDAEVPEEVKRLLEEQHLRLEESQSELDTLQRRIAEMQEARARLQTHIETERRSRITQELEHKLVVEDREYWKKQVMALKKKLKALQTPQPKPSNNRKRRNSNASLH